MLNKIDEQSGMILAAYGLLVVGLIVWALIDFWRNGRKQK
jgi:hypothetical protein